MMNNLPFLLVVLHKPTLWPSTFNHSKVSYRIKGDKHLIIPISIVQRKFWLLTSFYIQVWTERFEKKTKYLHPSKKVTQHDFNRLYQFVYGFVFIMLGIICKLGYLSFHWYLICHDCFAGTCAGRLNWVQCQKINVAKLDHNFNRGYQFVYEIIFIM